MGRILMGACQPACVGINDFCWIRKKRISKFRGNPMHTIFLIDPKHLAVAHQFQFLAAHRQLNSKVHVRTQRWRSVNFKINASCADIAGQAMNITDFDWQRGLESDCTSPMHQGWFFILDS
ncbi:hypothetical protein Rfer_0655 [Rhodoferax ferrireducens T118]|uniref:Uncharacterized protein n=1 Tax=Albidiferax ferrireducens (strain ATCC BAA-621 / DSM 15236 / T118) TaxID=338969 RepID=Q220Z7_ALBFT|nr:hypothetical protein Rfer_0655 [Rhodoferax ferrireducens T118]